MVLFKKFVRRHNRTSKIILSTVIGIAMAVFTLIPFSADSFEPVEFSTNALNALFSTSDINLLFRTSTTTYPVYSYTFNSSRSYIGLHQVYPSYNYDSSYFSFSQNSFYSKMPFIINANSAFQDTSTPNAARYQNYRYVVNFPINFYVYDTTLSFFIFTHYNDTTITVQYLDSGNETHNVSSTMTNIVNGSLSTISSYFSSGYIDNLNANILSKSFTQVSSVNSDYTVYSTRSYTCSKISGYLYKVNITFDSSEYYDVSSLIFNFNTNNDNVGNWLYPYIAFDTSSPITFYEYNSGSGSVDLSYIEDMLDTIGGQLDDVNDKLDDLSGPPSQQQQAAIDQVDNQLSTEYDDLQEQLDIIHSPEMPTELPTEDFSNLEDEATVINNYLGDLNLLNIFNVIVPAGCAGFLIYIVLRRF